MKRIFILLLGLTMTTVASAQFTGGGQYRSVPTNTTKKQVTNDHLKDFKYTTFSFILPTGASKPKAPLVVAPPVAPPVVVASPVLRPNFSFGFGVTVGEVYYLDFLKPLLIKGLAIGVDVSYFDSRLIFTKAPAGVFSVDELWGFSMSLGGRVGLIGSYNFLPEKTVDLYVDINPNFAAFWNGGSASDGEISVGGYSLFRGLMTVIGTRFRFDTFNVGIEWQLGSMKFNGSIEHPTTGSFDYKKQKYKQHSFNIKIGKMF